MANIIRRPWTEFTNERLDHSTLRTLLAAPNGDTAVIATKVFKARFLTGYRARNDGALPPGLTCPLGVENQNCWCLNLETFAREASHRERLALGKAFGARIGEFAGCAETTGKLKGKIPAAELPPR